MSNQDPNDEPTHNLDSSNERHLWPTKLLASVAEDAGLRETMKRHMLPDMPGFHLDYTICYQAHLPAQAPFSVERAGTVMCANSIC